MNRPRRVIVPISLVYIKPKLNTRIQPHADVRTLSNIIYIIHVYEYCYCCWLAGCCALEINVCIVWLISNAECNDASPKNLLVVVVGCPI